MNVYMGLEGGFDFLFIFVSEFVYFFDFFVKFELICVV